MFVHQAKLIHYVHSHSEILSGYQIMWSAGVISNGEDDHLVASP